MTQSAPETQALSPSSEKRAPQDPSGCNDLHALRGRLPASARKHLPGIVVALVAMALPFWVGPATLTIAVFVVIAAIGVTGLNVLIGFSGQVSLGHAFFLAVGGYAYAVLSNLTEQNLVFVPVAGLLAALLGAVIGPIALRVDGLYLAVMTLGLVFIGQHILFNAPDISGGAPGMAFPELVLGSANLNRDILGVGGFLIDPNATFYYLALVVLALATLATVRLRRSHGGRAMVAVKSNQSVAAASGIKVARTKIAAFAFSSGLAGLSGALYCAYIGYAQPSHWSLLLSFQFVAAVIIGGLGSFAGPVLGATIVFALPSFIKAITGHLGVGEDLSPGALAALVYGLLIICFLVLEPRGMAGFAERLGALRSTSPARPGRGAPTPEGDRPPFGNNHQNKENTR